MTVLTRHQNQLLEFVEYEKEKKEWFKGLEEFKEKVSLTNIDNEYNITDVQWLKNVIKGYLYILKKTTNSNKKAELFIEFYYIIGLYLPYVIKNVKLEASVLNQWIKQCVLIIKRINNLVLNIEDNKHKIKEYIYEEAMKVLTNTKKNLEYFTSPYLMNIYNLT